MPSRVPLRVPWWGLWALGVWWLLKDHFQGSFEGSFKGSFKGVLYGFLEGFL